MYLLLHNDYCSGEVSHTLVLILIPEKGSQYKCWKSELTAPADTLKQVSTPPRAMIAGVVAPTRQQHLAPPLLISPPPYPGPAVTDKPTAERGEVPSGCRPPLTLALQSASALAECSPVKCRSSLLRASSVSSATVPHSPATSL